MSDSSRRRRWSMELPPDLPEQTPSAEDHESTMRQALESYSSLTNLLNDSSSRQVLLEVIHIQERSLELLSHLPELLQLQSRAQDLLHHEASMRQALMEFNDILHEQQEASKMLEDVREKDNIIKKIVLGSLGVCVVALGVVAAPFTGGTSMAVATAAAGAAGAAGAGSSVGGIIDVHLYKKKINTITEKVEALVKKFLKIVEQLEKDLLKIKSLSEKLQESTVKNVSTVTLKKVKEVQKVLQQLSGSEKILGLLQGGGYVVSVGQLNSRSEEVFTKLEELRSALEALKTSE